MTKNITLDFIKTHSLMDCLREFNGAEESIVDSLLQPFKFLAQKMLYGGFLKVGDDYEIYIRTVEFYYHEEEESKNQIQDPIVYHRDGRFPDRKVPYFPIMTLHSHWSGFDITFEKKTGHYRASALIREFAVFDRHAGDHGSWVYWFTGKDYGEGRYMTVPKPKFDDRSTFLQFFLNGFSIDGTSNRVIWKDFKSPEYGKLTTRPRRNVFQDKEKKVPCSRPWAFRREDRLNSLREEE